MKLIKYIHGSEDSIDLDIYYVFDEMPEFKECQEFCSSKIENRNIIVIQNGIVVECFKGPTDEVNNSLLDTYNLHQQECPLLITKRLPRDVLIKDLRALRGMISYLSRTEYRTIVKKALKGNFTDRLNVMKNVNFNVLLEQELSKTFNLKDILKVYAFQLGQSLGLHREKELYTKTDIANEFSKLQPFLYRQNDFNLNDLVDYIEMFIDILEAYNVEELDNNITFFKDLNRKINIKNEKDVI